MVSSYLLPRLHSSIRAIAREAVVLPVQKAVSYHALLTSHHLISPNKRRCLQNWSSSLSITGFAKVGHPGVIYAQGLEDNVQEFVDNIKAMQWLALRVRFVEEDEARIVPEIQWQEFEKVGEVVQHMRLISKEKYVVEMGIGSAGATS